MQDSKEQEWIREHYAEEPGKGALIEQLMGERENAERLGDDSAILRVDAQLGGLGYERPGQRKAPKRAAREDEARAEREQERIKDNRGPAAARDDHAGGPVEQHAGVVTAEGDPLKGKAAKEAKAAAEAPADVDEGGGEDKAKGEARKQPPAGRQSKAAKQQEG